MLSLFLSLSLSLFVPKFFESENLDDAASAINDYTKDSLYSTIQCHLPPQQQQILLAYYYYYYYKGNHKIFKYFSLASCVRSMIILLMNESFIHCNGSRIFLISFLRWRWDFWANDVKEMK